MEGDRDAELYLAGCEGDREAVCELVRRHQSSLMSIARAMGLRNADALDVVQLVWLKLFQHLGGVAENEDKRLRNPAAIRAWLATTTRNAARDVHRKRRPSVSLNSDTDGHFPIDPADPTDSTAIIEEAELERVTRHAFARLDDPCRELLSLCVADPPLTYEEIADILGRPVGSLGPTRQRCLDKLRRLLKGAGYE